MKPSFNKPQAPTREQMAEAMRRMRARNETQEQMMERFVRVGVNDIDGFFSFSSEDTYPVNQEIPDDSRL